MYTRVFEVRVEASPEEVWKFHSSASALQALTPPSRKVKLLSKDLEVRDDAIHEMRIFIAGFIPVRWRARIEQVTPPFGFTDQAEKSPFKFWRHRHDFIPDGEGTIVQDVLVYEMPFGKLGKIVHKLFVKKDIESLFAYRHEATRKALG